MRTTITLCLDENTSASAWVGELVRQTVSNLDDFARARRHALRDLTTPVELANAAPLCRDRAHAR